MNNLARLYEQLDIKKSGSVEEDIVNEEILRTIVPPEEEPPVDPDDPDP
jgi:hypothetical protein